MEENNIPLCELLLRTTNINVINAEGKSALLLAVERYEGHEYKEECMEMIRFLLDRGASLQVSGSCYNALESARQRGLTDLVLVLIEYGEMAVQYGSDFRYLFEEAARISNTSAIRRLHDAQLHPLKRHADSRISDIVRAGDIADEVKELVAAMEHAAVESIWPSGDE